MPSGTKTIKSSGGDYTSSANWEAGEQANLTGTGPCLAECYSFADTTQLTIDGWTTTASDYIRIYTPGTERHDGKLNTSKYRLCPAAQFTRAVICIEEYVRFEGLQLANTHVGGRAILSLQSTGASDLRVDTCILYASGGDASGGHGIEVANNGGDNQTVLIRNTVIYGITVDGILGGFAATGNAVTIQNCTIRAGHYGVNRANTATTFALTNVYVSGVTDAYSGTVTRTTCAHSSATVFSGSTASVAHSTANFTNVTGGSEDYHLVTGSALIGAGTDLSGTFTTDVDGATRSAPWDIGADEYVAAGGTDVTVNADVMGVIASVPTATITGGASTAADVMGVVASVPAPVVAGGAQADADVLAATSSLPVPNVAGGAGVAAEVLAAAASIPPPTVGGEVSIDSDVLTSVATLQSPVSVAGGAAVAADVLAAVASFPPPDVSTGVTPGGAVRQYVWRTPTAVYGARTTSS